MGWFKRLTEGIQTSTKQKKEAPDGIWHKCKDCKTTIRAKELRESFSVCPNCGRHEGIGAEEYFSIIFEDQKYITLFDDLVADDVLKFYDSKPYTQRLQDARSETGLNDAMVVAVGKVGLNELVVAAMDFSFIAGSMGVVVGEKIARAIDFCIEHKTPLLIISKSGGARMQEAAFSLMQMAKTSAKLTLLAKAKIPYFSLMTNPTTGGVTASFAMLGDINFAEPKALIGFAGPRVVQETLKLKKLPEGFQLAENLLEYGFLDFIVERRYLKERLIDLLFLYDTYHIHPELMQNEEE